MKGLKEVYQKALVNKPVLDSLLNRVAAGTGGRAISNLKNPETTIKKVKTKNEEDPKRNYKLEDVNDIARGRLVYPDMQSMRQGVDAFERNVDLTGAHIIHSKNSNYFEKPEEGYKGLHIDIKFPNGQISEVQFHTANSYAFALATHGLHEQYGDESPEQLGKRKEALAANLERLSPQGAQQISAPIEQANQPAIEEAQQAAMMMAQGRSINNPSRGFINAQTAGPMGPMQ